MTRRKCISAFFLLFVVHFSLFASTSSSTRISARAESPADASIWIGTSDNGLLRLGRNGKSIHYTAKDGKIPSDCVKTLFFDADKVLWILYGNGEMGYYTSTGGFEVAKNLPSPILAAAPADGRIYFALSDALYSLSGKENAPEKRSALETAPVALYTAEDGTLLIQYTDGLERYNGTKWTFTAVEEEMGSPIEIQTPTETTQTTKSGRKTPLLFLLVLLFAALILVLRSRKKTALEAPVSPISKEKEPVQEQKPATEKKPVVPKVAAAPEQSENILKLEPLPSEGGPFTAVVTQLIKEHLSEPDFDVEEIAAITGISRIHVNRKLKAEGSESPSVILKRERMALAAEYIKEGEKTISEIAVLCGFRTQAYFSTAFKEFYGCKPSDYKVI